MNLVIVSDFAHVTGGNAAVALASAAGLAKRGHAVTLFAGMGPVAPEIADSPVSVVCTDQQAIGDDRHRGRAAIQGIWNLKAGRMIAATLARMDPRDTIVHVHGWDKVLSSSVVRAARSMGTKIVCTLHDYVSVCPNGGFYNHPRDEVCRLEPLSAACVLESCDRRGYGHKLWRVARHYAQEHWGGLPGAVKHVIVVSEFSRRILTPFLPPAVQVHHVQNMVDVPRQAPADPGSSEVFLMVGRLSREKGPHLLASVAGRMPWMVRFIGDGESVGDIRRLAPQSTVTGWLAKEAVLKEMAGARALIFPSLWHETEGLVVLEAASLGIPCVVADGCAARELVVDQETGLHFRSGDEKDLQRVMSQLVDPELARKLGQGAYQRYWRNPRSLDHHLSELERVYALVLRDD